MVHKLSLFTLLLLTVLLSSCAQSTKRSAIPPASTATPTKTSMPTLISTLQPTRTPTAIPTLSMNAARARLLDLLANNGGCRLPCLWGIMLGKTTNLEAWGILEPLASISNLTSLSDSPGTIWPTYIEDDLRTSIKLSYLFAREGIVSHISFDVGESKDIDDNRIPIYDSKTLGERLRPYMLPGILSEFGKPGSVVIQTYGKQITGSGGFEIVLVYPEQGIFVHYITQMKTVGVNVRGCPANAQVQLELYPSGDADAFAKSLDLTDWGAFGRLKPMDDSGWKSIDKATSMSLEQFYETFRQPTDKCIETPSKGWHVPEQ